MLKPGFYRAEITIGKIVGLQKSIRAYVQIFRIKGDKRNWVRGFNLGEAALFDSAKDRIQISIRAQRGEVKTAKEWVRTGDISCLSQQS